MAGDSRLAPGAYLTDGKRLLEMLGCVTTTESGDGFMFSALDASTDEALVFTLDELQALTLVRAADYDIDASGQDGPVEKAAASG